MKKITQYITVAIFIIASTAQMVFANITTPVRSFEVLGLNAYKGKNLSVYYVSARPATLETNGQIAKVRKILKGPLTFKIASDGTVKIPATDVPREGWSTFNHLIFVIHAQKSYFLRNVDGTIPEVLDKENEVMQKSEHAPFLFRKSMEFHRSFGEKSIRLY